jgi:hypothetical protein
MPERIPIESNYSGVCSDWVNAAIGFSPELLA